jgi:hypothetical protein
MRASRVRWACLLGAIVVAGGCTGSAPPPPQRVKTGAEDAALSFFNAVIQREWDTAYQTLAAKSKKACSAERFQQRGKAYCDILGFEPSAVQVQACGEQGDRAIAHVSIKGTHGTSMRFYKDAVALERGPSGWEVVLPASFGRKSSSFGLPTQHGAVDHINKADQESTSL